MSRPRQQQKDLPPGLYCYPGRSCYVKIGSMKPVDLGTQDRKDALAIYWGFRKLWDAEHQEKQAQQLADRLETAAKGGDVMTVADYARKWRKWVLPALLKKNGKPLAQKTLDDYGRMIENAVETYEPFTTLAVGSVRTKDTRQFLSRWIGTPSYYNYVKAALARMFTHAVDEGLLDANPCAEVNRRAVARREVILSVEHYLRITGFLEEWEARACDLVYLISHRPSDVLRLRDEEPFVRYEQREFKVPTINGFAIETCAAVVVSFTATKNEQAVEIADRVDAEGGIADTLQWFRAWKESQEIVTKAIVVYPKTARPKDIGRPVSRDYLSRRFAEAVVKAGFDAGTYTLRDLRKTGLTDEARIAGKATDKGGHKTEQMKQYYVVGGVPLRVRNNLVVLRGRG